MAGFIRAFLGTLAAGFIFQNPSVLCFAAGTVTGVYLGQRYELPDVGATIQRCVVKLFRFGAKEDLTRLD